VPRRATTLTLSVLCAAAFGFAVASASGDHYHVCCGGGIYQTGHALVHGASDSDNVWHGRSTANQVLVQRYCAAGSSGSGLKGYSYAGTNQTCEIQVSGSAFYYHDIEQCYAWGYIDPHDGVTSAHYHYAHNRFSCGSV
jgi:hypothetical protein